MTTFSTATAACHRVDSLVELLSQQSEHYSGNLAFRFCHEDGGETTLTFAELDGRARAIGARLAEQLQPGDRALLVYPPGLEFISAFFGCLYAGVVATPATYPKPRRPLPRMSRIAQDSGAVVALTTQQTLATIDLEQQDDAARNLDWVATDTLAAADDAWRPHEAVGDDLAFLQYTSGSTSEPKGVMVSHANLLANLEAIRNAFGLPAGSMPDDPNAGVFWLPAYHDMGLIGGVLTPLYVGGPSILMPPTTFLKRPLGWLETIDRFRATISGAPDFAYRLCTERMADARRNGKAQEFDLSSWRLAFCGAEPIHAGTLTSFADAFESNGFNPTSFFPCYGLAEATLLAAGPACTDPPTILSVDRSELGGGRAVATGDVQQAQQLVGCGRAPEGHELLIIDPENLTALPERAVGEIVFRGPSVAEGYWRRGEESAEAFDCRINGGQESYLRTGDLGFFYEGELFVTGRVKDVIIIRGRNYYPQDIEQTAESAHPDVLPGAAFSVAVTPAAEIDSTSDEPERLVLVHQINRACRGGAREEVAQAIRRAVQQEHEIDPHAVVLIRQTSLPVTSSGKVQRSRCRELYLTDQLNPLHVWQRAESQPQSQQPASRLAAPEIGGLTVEDASERIEEWMQHWLVERAELDVSLMDRDRPFAELGLDSMTAVELSGELEETFGVPLPAVVAWNYPTPAALARYLAQESLGGGSPSEGELREQASNATDERDIETLLADIENMSDDQAQRLLDNE